MKKILFSATLLALGLGVFAQENCQSQEKFNINSNNSKNIAIEQNNFIKQEKVLPKAIGNIYQPVMNLIGKYKNEVKIIYTDIDGIIIPETHKTISFKDCIYKSFANLKENNIPVVFTTGRTYRETKRISDALELNTKYFITQNGAEIENQNGDIIYEEPLDNIFVKKINKEVKWFNYHYKQNIKIAFYIRGQVYVYRLYQIPDLVDIPVIIDKFSQLPMDVKVSTIRIYCNNKKNLDIFKRYLTKNYKNSLNIYNVTENHFDINSKMATKENSVKYLSELEKINLSNSAAFGYSQKDIGLMNLLRENGGLAISTEKSFQEVKDASSYITKDVENDGFTFAINTILGNNLILKSEANNELE